MLPAASWDCDTTASFSALDELHDWYETVAADPPLGVDDALEAWREGLIDDRCSPIDCSFPPRYQLALGYTSDVCVTYACVTDAGYAISYSADESVQVVGSITTTRAEVAWQVEGPDGAIVRLTSTLHVEDDDLFFDSMDVGTFDLEASWDGQPVASLPADEGVLVHEDETSYDDSGIAAFNAAWSTAGCTISTRYTAATWVAEGFAVQVGATSGLAETQYDGCRHGTKGTFDGVVVGAVDPGTWAVLDSDADHDGVDADEDCDDTDPTVNPCDEDVPDDGIDQDCDGLDSHAFSPPPGCAGALPFPLLLLRRRR